MVAVLSSVLLIGYSYRNILRSIPYHGQTMSDMSRYGQPSNTTNKFIRKFEDVLLNNLGHDKFIPLILENGKLLCRRKHKQQLSRYRTRFFSQMVRKGLSSQNYSSINIDSGLPILAIDADENGYNVHLQRDEYQFPRLTWSELSPKHGKCEAISMPSYETWKYYHRSHKVERHWEGAFRKNEKHYPWGSKIKKAVWRGSTTYEGSQYHQSELGETPRGKLVNISTHHPNIIDARFHKIIQKFKTQRHDLAGQGYTVAKRINPNEMMRYKAIIDIDGNNWSSRFGMLLCSNSVVIKIEPDFIEYFYSDRGHVKPMVHYVPASLQNITEVVAYVMDKKNENEMKAMISSANSWCKNALSEKGLAKDSILQLEVYKRALDSHDEGWRDKWKTVRRQFADTIGDLVDCNPWSIIDPFTFPMFAGL